ncbi:MAG TPA: hypothetical protein VLI69_03610 [Gammaproteobacteria bacterium]|nr:hypothetical protein [Gammaproteobacteria bacterium]
MHLRTIKNTEEKKAGDEFYALQQAARVGAEQLLGKYTHAKSIMHGIMSPQLKMLNEEEKIFCMKRYLKEIQEHDEGNVSCMTENRKKELSGMKAERLSTLHELASRLNFIAPNFSEEKSFSIPDSAEVTVADLKNLDLQISTLEEKLIAAEEVHEKTLSSEDLARITTELQNKIEQLIAEINDETREYLNLKLLERQKNYVDSSTENIINKHSFLITDRTNLRRYVRELQLHLKYLKELKKILLFIAEKVSESGLLIANLVFYYTPTETLRRYRSFFFLLKSLDEEFPSLLQSFHRDFPCRDKADMLAYSAYMESVIALESFTASLKNGFSRGTCWVPPFPVKETVSKTGAAYQRMLYAKELEEARTATQDECVKKFDLLYLEHEKLVQGIKQQVAYSSFLDKMVSRINEPTPTLSRESKSEFIRSFVFESKDFACIEALLDRISRLKKIFNYNLTEINKVCNFNFHMQIKEIGLLIAQLAIYLPFVEIFVSYLKLIELIDPDSNYRRGLNPIYVPEEAESLIASLTRKLAVAQKSSCENEMKTPGLLPASLPSVAPMEPAQNARRVRPISPVRLHSVFPLPPSSTPVAGPAPETPDSSSVPVASRSRSPSPGSI